MDDLDAGLHARPGPVVGDGADDAAEPQRPCKRKRTNKGINSISIPPRERRHSRAGGEERIWKLRLVVPTARSLCSTTHSLADCSAPFSSAMSPAGRKASLLNLPNRARAGALLLRACRLSSSATVEGRGRVGKEIVSGQSGRMESRTTLGRGRASGHAAVPQPVRDSWLG